MLIKHIGHAEFLIETESGVRIVTDPYDASCGYPLRKVTADVALISHHHHDHDAVENLKGEPRIIDTAGENTPESGVKITALRGFHDDAGGGKRRRRAKSKAGAWKSVNPDEVASVSIRLIIDNMNRKKAIGGLIFNLYDPGNSLAIPKFLLH